MNAPETPATHCCNKLSVEYDPNEDRLVFHGRISDQDSVSFYITARFLSLLVRHLFSNENLATLKSEWENQPSMINPLEEPVEPEALQDNNINSAETSTDRTQSQSPMVATPRYPLVNRCDITVNETQQVALKFDLSNRTEPCYVQLDLPKSALLQVLQIWHQKFIMAGWSLACWPDSTRLPDHEVTTETQIIVH